PPTTASEGAAPRVATTSPAPREAYAPVPTPRTAAAPAASGQFVPLTNYATADQEPEMKEYTVVRGDSFYKIAKDHGITTRALMAANPAIEPSRLQVGAKIKVPAPEPAASGGQGASGGDAGNGGQVYTVKSGDTLTGIAQR